MTFLAILAADAIAVPLCPTFPTSELQYVADHCEISLLAASPRFLAKAQDLLDAGLRSSPGLVKLEKHAAGEERRPLQCALERREPTSSRDGGYEAGMMLYTSGTTSRPVRA